MTIQIIKQDDPITVAIDAECQASLARLCLAHNLDPLSVAIAMSMILTRQLAIVDQPRAAKLVKAISDEIASNWTDPMPTHRRVTLTTELSAIAKEKGAAMAQADAARAAGQIS